MEWGHKIKVLLAAKRKGLDPEALRNRPILPWYYEALFNHFTKLSFARVQGEQGFNPIDIGNILRYNSDIAKYSDPSFFLDVIQHLDSLFLKKRNQKST